MTLLSRTLTIASCVVAGYTLRQLELKYTMRHLPPKINKIVTEAINESFRAGFDASSNDHDIMRIHYYEYKNLLENAN